MSLVGILWKRFTLISSVLELAMPAISRSAQHQMRTMREILGKVMAGEQLVGLLLAAVSHPVQVYSASSLYCVAVLVTQ
jgi:hypothetical protein